MTRLKLLYTAVLAVLSIHASAGDFVWSGKQLTNKTSITDVALSNNLRLEKSKGADSFDQAVTVSAAKSKQKSDVVRNDFAAIEAAYPSPKKAVAVLVSDSCAGSACGDSTTITLVLPSAGGVKKYPIDNPSKITLTFEGDRVIGGLAEGVSAGVDKYGSEVMTASPFIPGAGFVAMGFRREYAKLIGEHPIALFDDKVLREPFAKATGLETFRDLRTAISVASETYLVQGRYIVLQGCMPHDCGGNYSFVMIDAVTSGYFWARFNEGRTRYSGSSQKIDKAAIQAVFSDPRFQQNDDARLVISPVGKIMFKTGAR
jgi:hypothetical protein